MQTGPEEFEEPSAAVAEAQRVLREVAGELAAVVLRLESLTTALPRSAEEDSMLELLIPSDVATEVRTTIECVLHDDLRPAIRALATAAEVTEEELRRDFPGAS